MLADTVAVICDVYAFPEREGFYYSAFGGKGSERGTVTVRAGGLARQGTPAGKWAGACTQAAFRFWEIATSLTPAQLVA